MTAPGRPDQSAIDVLAVARLARYLERACTDLTLAQYRVLALVADGERHASRVAHALALGKPTVSASVEALAERGLLTRAPAGHDKRATELSVTAEGRRVLHATETAMRARLDDLLDPDDAAAVADALARVQRALDDRRAGHRSGRSE
ncbi:MAG: MarR family winged helix-turn-helix transcriptional regulator [Acidimicrobiia bacterium]